MLSTIDNNLVVNVCHRYDSETYCGDVTGVMFGSINPLSDLIKNPQHQHSGSTEISEIKVQSKIDSSELVAVPNFERQDLAYQQFKAL